MNPPRIAILASGGGTTAEAFIRANHAGEINVKTGLIIVSRPDAGIFERINNLNKELGENIETVLVSDKNYPLEDGELKRRGYQTRAEEAAMLELLKRGNFDLVALMGYMKHMGPSIVQEFGWLPDYQSIYDARMLNTHPGLLPETASLYGAKIQQYVLDNHLPYGGHSVHLVSEEYDDGPVIAEHKVAVIEGDTAESLFERVQATEKEYLPHDIENFILGRRDYLNQEGERHG